MKIVEVIYLSGAPANIAFDNYEIEMVDGVRLVKGDVVINGAKILQELNITPSIIMRTIFREATTEEVAKLKGITLSGTNAFLGPKGGV